MDKTGYRFNSPKVFPRFSLAAFRVQNSLLECCLCTCQGGKSTGQTIVSVCNLTITLTLSLSLSFPLFLSPNYCFSVLPDVYHQPNSKLSPSWLVFTFCSVPALILPPCGAGPEGCVQYSQLKMPGGGCWVTTGQFSSSLLSPQLLSWLQISEPRRRQLPLLHWNLHSA